MAWPSRQASSRRGVFSASLSLSSLPSLSLLFLLLSVSLSTAFNVDTKNAVVHTRTGIKFGYALDFFFEQKGLPVLMVGAPESETASPKLRGIKKPGAVFACSLTQANLCKEVFADSDEGNERRLNGSRMVPIEDKSNQFFGATVRASNKHDKIMMCAPQYKYFFTKFEVIEPVGACFFLSSGAAAATELAPCRQDNQKHGRHRLGYGQCGFSAAVPDAADGRSFIGAPGMFYWQGGIFSQSNSNYSDRLNSSYSPKEYDHFMMGYATATGDVDGDGVEDAVAGAPRGDDLAGKLVLYTAKLRNIGNLTDTTGAKQTGQYCGHAIAVVDLNKDGKPDIVTGCPFFTDYVTVVDAKTQERKPQYEVGKVLVYINRGGANFDKPIAIVGEDQWGRFGFSIAAAGDLNLDGYNDVIVGAPHGGKDERGAIYVLHGSKDGIREKHTQKIEASKLGTGVRSLGFSVAGGIDVDGNGFPDIAAGGVKSGSAIVLLSKPVVTVKGRTELDKPNVAVDERSCDVDRKIGTQACRQVKVCMRYDGKGETPNDLDFVLVYHLDDLSKEPRAHFISRDIQGDRTLKASEFSKTKDHPNVLERRIRLEKNHEKCFTQRFFVSSTMRDRLSPIHYTVNYTYVESASGKLRGGKLEPALDSTVPLSYEGKLSIANNCGKDDLCVPNLAVRASTDKPKFILGTRDNSMLVKVDVDNRGEDAFETKLFVDIPEGFEFGGIETPEGKTPPSCAPTTEKPDENGNWKWECDIGNPLPATKKSEIGIRLAASETNPPTAPVTIHASVNSTNPEEASAIGDNSFSLTVPIDFAHNLGLLGQTNPEQVDFATTNRSEHEKFDDRELGPLVSHLYQVTNQGVSRMDATLDVFWPSFSTDGNHLLYLITEPTLSNPERGECRVKQYSNVNPLNLRLTDEHIMTAPPPTEYEHEDEDEEEGEEEEERHGGDHEVASPEAGQGAAKATADTENESHFEWHDEEKPQKFDYEYIPDEEYADEEEEDKKMRKRVAREAKPPKRKKGGKAKPAAAAAPQDDRARFADLREAVAQSKSAGGAVDYSGVVSRASVDCSALRCTHIECDLHGIEKGEYVLVQIFSRLVTDTLVEERNPGGDVSSLAIARVINQNKNIPHKQTMVVAVTTHMNAIPSSSASGGIPWWLYLIAILIGLLILALLILLLWRCGFFKRNRPPTEKAEKRAGGDPDARYADTKTRYAPGSEQYYDERRAML